MALEQGPTAGNADERSGLLALAVVSILVGAMSGLVGAGFQSLLGQADRCRGWLIVKAHEYSPGGIVIIIAMCAATTAIAAWLVRRYAPHASGSGIPHVEAVLNRQLPQAPIILLPVKFIGGILAIGAGLALGREGPSIQMGASIAHVIGRTLKRTPADCLVLLAAGAGAGLATAFNAPVAGAVFVLEELARRFDTRITIATFGASAGAIAVSRFIIGQGPEFHVEPIDYAGFGTAPVYLALGIIAGFLGVAYNLSLLGALRVSDRLGRWPVEIRAAAIGAFVGIFAFCAPNIVGGGDAITQTTLMGHETLQAVALIFLIRFGLGAVSYAAQTPGGLFAPMLVLGAQSGLFLGTVGHRLSPALVPNPIALGVVGMAAFFTAVVRAPVTGVILVIEMTGSFTLLLPMMTACFAAMLVPTLLGNPPIYDSLRDRDSRRRI